MPEYYLYSNGKKVSVSEEVYRTFMRPVWAEKKRKSRAKEGAIKVLSLDTFLADGYTPISNDRLTANIVEDKLLLEMLYTALLELTEKERDIINALFFNDKTERQAADEIGVSQKTVNNRKKKILAKLRKLLE